MAAQARLRLPSTITFLAVHAATAAPAAATSCAPRTCGNLTIAYPFWVPDQQPSSPSSSEPACGPSAFQVDCHGGRASLARLFRGDYKILRVSYADRTVLVTNDNVQTDALHSLSFAPFTASTANAQLVFLFNCTGGSKPPPAGFVNVTCPGAQAVVRLDARYNTTDARAVAGGCDYSVVPVMGSSAGDGVVPVMGCEI